MSISAATPPYTATITHITVMDGGVFHVRLTKPSGYIFLAGQYLTIHYADRDRPYSIASAPYQPFLDLIIKSPDPAKCPIHKQEIAVGKPIQIGNPIGKMTLWPQTASVPKHVIMAGGGTGIAPFFSILGEALHRVITNTNTNIPTLNLVHINANTSENYGAVVFQDLVQPEAEHIRQKLQFQNLITHGDATTNTAAEQNLQKGIENLLVMPVLEFSKTAQDTNANSILVYLCGRDGLVSRLANTLRSRTKTPKSCFLSDSMIDWID